MSVRSALSTVAATPVAVRVRRRLLFGGTARYWENRYSRGGNSGAGSYGAQARWKADLVNRWVRIHGVESVIDLGCGDGSQLSLADYPSYLGLDVSPAAVRACVDRFRDDPGKSFLCYDPAAFDDSAGWLRADLALSLEVVFHLVEDEIFEGYMHRLFDSARRFVVIGSYDTETPVPAPHERHRCFTGWVARNRPEWVVEDRADPPAGVHLGSTFVLFRRSAQDSVSSPSTSR